ncbi:hypothetical protein AXX16_3349 [Serratia rubidaea]|nr:hypothetical protein AXX16_3349 [Serratia rubidaea]
MAQHGKDRDILGKVLLSVSALCLAVVIGFLVWAFVLD